MTNVKKRSLALTSGIVGLAGGIILIFGFWFVVGGAYSDSTNNTTNIALGTAGGLMILKIAILILGIIATIYYKGDSRVGVAPSVLLIIGGAIALIPLLGWVGGIISVVGGALFLGKLKNFNPA